MEILWSLWVQLLNRKCLPVLDTRPLHTFLMEVHTFDQLCQSPLFLLQFKYVLAWLFTIHHVFFKNYFHIYLQGQKYTGILYYLSGALLICSSLSAYFASETRGVVLQDTLGTKNVGKTSNSTENGTAAPSVSRIVSTKYPSEHDNALSGQDGKFEFLKTYLWSIFTITCFRIEKKQLMTGTIFRKNTFLRNMQELLI